MLRDQILADLKRVVKGLGYKVDDLVLSIPKNPSFGNYSTNVALQLAKQNSGSNNHSNIDIAKQIVDKLGESDYLDKAEIAGGGFINLFLKKEALLKNLHTTCDYSNLVEPKLNLKRTEKKILVEYASFNALKPIHVGHLRNITLGESISRLLEAEGGKVYRMTYTSDIGLPSAKVVWGIQRLIEEFKVVRKGKLIDKVNFLGKAYVEGARSYEEDPACKEEIDTLNKNIYQRDDKVTALWQEALKWTFEYFDTVYRLMGTKFDKEILESEVEQRGSMIVRDNIDTVFEKDSGAIIFPGEKFGLHNRVFITGVGNPTYEAKDLGLAEAQYEAFPFDLAIHVVARDQVEYFKVVFKALELLHPDLAIKERHLSYGYVTLASGKMSSRTGKVVTLELVYQQVKDLVMKVMDKDSKDLSTKEKDHVIEVVTLGAIKFSILKFAPNTDIVFDLEKSVSLQGDSGPYVQYTYARAKSVLRNAAYNYLPTDHLIELEKEELGILRRLEHFPVLVEDSASGFSPHLIANFLLDLSKDFNYFYQKHPILKADSSTRVFRLALTCAVAVVIKQGLYLLGIEAPEQM